MMYNWQQKDWPHFSYELSSLTDDLQDHALWSGILIGALRGITAEDQSELIVEYIAEEAQKTSAIEGELIEKNELYSSIRNHLGLNSKPQTVHDQRAQSIVDLIFAVRETFTEPLSESTLFDWHRLLFNFPMRLSNVEIGEWRTHKEPMQVISGHPGKITVHYEAPPSDIVPNLMKEFIDWFNQSAPKEPDGIKSEVIRAGIAHLYFESIHPFVDGNGRIGRVIAEKALSQGIGLPILFSISHTIEQNRKQYYQALKTAQSSNEITLWLKYFIQIVIQAQKDTDERIAFAITKTKFLAKYEPEMNDRQIKVIRRMLQEGPKGFSGGMSTKKYMAITKASKATATRDLTSLYRLGVLKLLGGGRSIHYELIL